jgi:RNA polymerase sigma-70 factor, ECF subfamily
MNTEEARRYVADLFVAHRDDIYGYLHGMCHNTHISEDITAETFERAMRAMTRPDAKEHPTPLAWLRTIARNLLTDHWRRASRRLEVPMEVTDDLHRPVVFEPDEHLPDLVREVRRVLDRLTDSQRQVVLLRDYQDLDTVTTARQMGRSPQAVRSLQHKARRRIEAIRDEDEAEAEGA